MPAIIRLAPVGGGHAGDHSDGPCGRRPCRRSFNDLMNRPSTVIEYVQLPVHALAERRN